MSAIQRWDGRTKETWRIMDIVLPLIMYGVKLNAKRVESTFYKI